MLRRLHTGAYLASYISLSARVLRYLAVAASSELLVCRPPRSTHGPHSRLANPLNRLDQSIDGPNGPPASTNIDAPGLGDRTLSSPLRPLGHRLLRNNNGRGGVPSSLGMSCARTPPIPHHHSIDLGLTHAPLHPIQARRGRGRGRRPPAPQFAGIRTPPNARGARWSQYSSKRPAAAPWWHLQ